MNRRSFLLLANSDGGKTIELSCHALYMHIMDICTAQHISSTESNHKKNIFVSDEPPAVFGDYSFASLFYELQVEFSNCSKLKLIGCDWILSGEFREKFEAILADFVNRGGEIIFVDEECDFDEVYS